MLILEITRPTNPVALPLIRFYMQKLVPRIGWLRRRNKSTVKLMQYYWATIQECVPPKVIITALADSGFKNVKRTVSNGGFERIRRPSADRLDLGLTPAHDL